jgi:dolichyl-phosphate-mannose--protein O-mannosyl transferase
MVEFSVRDLIPFLVVAVQCYIFFSVESIEMKFALVAVFLFQIWQKSKSRKVRNTDGENEETQQAEPATKRKGKKKE